MFCCVLLCVQSNLAIILMGKNELVALPASPLSRDCYVALSHDVTGLSAVCDS